MCAIWETSIPDYEHRFLKRDGCIYKQKFHTAFHSLIVYIFLSIKESNESI